MELVHERCLVTDETVPQEQRNTSRRTLAQKDVQGAQRAVKNDQATQFMKLFHQERFKHLFNGGVGVEGRSLHCHPILYRLSLNPPGPSPPSREIPYFYVYRLSTRTFLAVV